jgi:hygromycin-B 7''-O-kinase
LGLTIGKDNTHQREPLLPLVTSKSDYEAIRPDANLWLLVMQVICRRHGLPTEKLVQFGDGMNIVFAVDEHHVIKLYPPYWRRLFEADLSVAEHVSGKLSIMTPEICSYGALDGWPYLVMSRLQGTSLAALWDTLGETEQLRLAAELAEVLAQLHALPTHDLPLLEADWPEFVATRMNGCVQRHREQGVPDAWLQQLPEYLAFAAPLYPSDFIPAIVSGDIHDGHLLVKQENGLWRLCGLFDFDDLTYGYAEAQIDERLSHRLMAYTLLHRYRPLNWVSGAFAKHRCSTFEELARVMYALR